MSIKQPSKSLVILDEDHDFRQALQIALDGHDFQVFETSSLDDTAHIAERHTVDVLVASADLLGSDLDGAQVVRRQSPKLVCVITTNVKSDELDRLAQQRDWIQVVQRPIQMISFVAQITNALRST